MARIKSQQALIDYIKSQLGYPTINIEVTDEQIKYIIDDSIQKFSEYAYGTLEAASLLELSGMGTYDMPEAMTNVLKLSVGGTNSITNFGAQFGKGFVPNMWTEQKFSNSVTGNIINSVVSISATQSILDKYFGDDIVYNFNHLNKKLQVLEDYHGSVVLYYQYEYLPNEDDDLVYNHEWIKAYVKAKTKELWSIVTGKFNQALVGGAQINYDKMAQEAERDIEKLDQELLTKWSDPCPIDIG